MKVGSWRHQLRGFHWAVLVITVFFGPAFSWAQAGFTFKYTPLALGSADIWGYASWSSPAGSISLNGNVVPLRLDFTSDPRPSPAPSPLGRGWLIQFFASALVEEDQSTLRWHRPDGRIFYFARGRGNQQVKAAKLGDPIEFISTEASWRAVKEFKNPRIILTHDKSGATLVYEDGLLVKFCLTQPAERIESYAITYNRLRRPQKLLEVSSGKSLVEFIYEDGRLAKEMRIGDKAISLSYVDVSLNQFSAGPYLSNAGEGSSTSLIAKYQVAKNDGNRIEFESLTSAGGRASLLWDATSGFLREDDNATYKIENPSLANNGRPLTDVKVKSGQTPGSQGQVTAQAVDYNWRPDEAKVTRIDPEGKSEFRFYDRTKGIVTKTSKEGVTTKTYHLLTQGPMMNKVRKIEEYKDGKWTTIERNAFDEKGRMVRQITRDGLISIWDYASDGLSFTKYIDGTIAEERLYEADKLSSVKSYVGGVLTEYKYTYPDGLRVMTLIKDGKVEWRRTFKGNKTLKFEAPAEAGAFTEYLFDESGAPLPSKALDAIQNKIKFIKNEQ